MSQHVNTLGRNLLLSLAGEGLQSGFHFLLNLLLIRALAAYDYGLFAIVFILGGVALTYGSALVSTPATVHIPRLKSPGAVRFQEAAFGSVAAAMSVAIAVIAALSLWLIAGSIAEAFAGGAFVGMWTLRNHLRAVMFARRDLVAATISDFSYSACGIATIAALLYLQSGAPPLTRILWALAASNVIGISVALLRLQSPVRVSFGRGVRRHYRVIWPEITWSLVGVTTWNIQGQTPTFLVAAIVGPAAYAPIAAGLVLFSPLRPAVGAFINVVRPEFAAGLAAKRYADVRLTLYGLLGVITLCCLGLGMAIWLGWGFLEQHIFAGKFANASMPLIVVLAGVATLLAQSYFMPLTLLQARRDFKTVALATTFGGAVGLLATLILLFTSGVAWSLAGLAAGEAVCWIYLWLSALRVLNDTRTPPPAFALASDGPPGLVDGQPTSPALTPRRHC